MPRMTAKEIRQACAKVTQEISAAGQTDVDYAKVLAITHLMQFTAEVAAQLADHYELLEAKAGRVEVH